jgi:hypothetical protein
VRHILRSYRWRRRLLWSAAFVALLLAGVATVLLVPEEAPRRAQELGGATGELVTEAEPAEVPVSAAERRAVNRTLRAFIATAVTRDDPAAAWGLVTRSMRAGVTRVEWNRGDLPVVPYPVVVPEDPDWVPVTSYRGDLTLDLILQPKPGSGRPAVSFFVELKRAHDGRWLIDSMVAEDFFGAGSAKPRTTKAAQGATTAAGPRGRLDPTWIALPLALLALIVLVPAAIGVVTWRRQRAIDRRYRAQVQRRRP